jgi:hypothetical protein
MRKKTKNLKLSQANGVKMNMLAKIAGGKTARKQRFSRASRIKK